MMRILHVGIGPLGQRIQRDLLGREGLRTVAAFDFGPAIGGRLLSELVEEADPRLRIETTLEALQDWSAVDVAIVTTSSQLARCADVFRMLLARGLPVVSTCEELVFPWATQRALAEDLDAVAKRHGGRLLGTGVNPGFLMDSLPLFATSVSRRVDRVEVLRRQDATARRITFQRKIGVALSLADFHARVADGSLRHMGLAESAHFLAHNLDFPLERWTETIEPVIAERALTSSLGAIAPGMTAGMRQVGEGFARGKSVIRLEFLAAIGVAGAVDRVHVFGEPDLELSIQGGVPGDIAASAIVLNALETIRAAPPGLHTLADLPAVRFRRD